MKNGLKVTYVEKCVFMDYEEEAFLATEQYLWYNKFHNMKWST